MKGHDKSLDRPSLKLDCPSGRSCLTSFSPNGLCLCGSSLPGEPSCQDAERNHQMTKHHQDKEKYQFYFNISICDISYIFHLLFCNFSHSFMPFVNSLPKGSETAVGSVDGPPAADFLTSHVREMS